MSQEIRRTRLCLLVGTLGVLSGLVVACNSDEISAMEADQLEQATAPIAPAEMLKCWVTPDTANSDPFFQAHPLNCAAVLPASYPLRPRTYQLTVLKKGGGIADVTLNNDQTLEVTRLLNSDFPVELRWNVRFSSAVAEAAGAELQNYGLRRVAAISSVGQATEGAPLVEKIPFTLWPVTLRNPGKKYASLMAAGYTVSVLPFAAGDSNSETNNGEVLKVTGQLATRDAFRSGVFVAPPSGEITVRMVPAGTEGKITGPGSYEIVNGALVQVSKSALPPAPLSADAEAPGDGGAKEFDASLGDAQEAIDASSMSDAASASDAT